MELNNLCDSKAATVGGGNKIRPCDACGIRRASWFCAADNAHLCHLCDTSVHSANSVACRHERVKLSSEAGNFSSWSRKRSRSDRKLAIRPKQGEPELQLTLYDQHFMGSDVGLCGIEGKELDLELGSLIGAGSHDEQEDHLSLEWLFDRVKVEVEEGSLKIECPDDEPFDLNVKISDLVEEEEEMKVNLDVDDFCLSNSDEKKIGLKLNYEDVLSAWCGRGSPWADKNSFHTFLDDSVFEATGGLDYGVVPDLNGGGGGCEESIEDVPVTQYKSSGGFREARVMRYREKRRNRLFSKRIRYQVRKLNAEQRPRMKGRFVKKEPELFSEHKHKR